MKKLFALGVATTLIAGCGLSMPSLSTQGSSTIGAKRQLPKGAKKWTIMMHVAADNNLYGFGLEDMNEMEAGINPDDVNVIVLFDGDVKGDSAVYEIKRDPDGMNAKFVSVPNTNVPFIPSNHEINSGDPNVLKAFGSWAIKQYPAEHYMLGVWDHGSGIFRKGANQATPFLSRGFSWDDSGTNMNTKDLSTLMPAMAAAAGQPIDILGFDACLMAHVEIAYQAKDAVNHLVASEELEPGAGWDYAGWLKGVTAKSTPAQVASSLVDSFGKSYQPGGSQNPNDSDEITTLSATDVKALNSQLVPAINNLSMAMTAAMPGEAKLFHDVRYDAQSFYNNDCADLGHFLKLLLAANPSDGVKKAALEAQRAVDACVIRETHTGKPVSRAIADASGLVIYFPRWGQTISSAYEASNIAFAGESWKSFLVAFLKRDSR